MDRPGTDFAAKPDEIVNTVKRFAQVAGLAWVLAGPLAGSTAVDGALNGAKICDLTQKSDVVGAGWLTLESPAAEDFQKQMDQALGKSTPSEIGAIFKLSGDDYFKRDSSNQIQGGIQINYSYNVGMGGSQRPSIYSYYLRDRDNYPNGMRVVFFANKPAASVTDITLIERGDQLNLDDVWETYEFNAKPTYQSISQEIMLGKSNFAIGFAIAQIFDQRPAQALALEENTGLKGSWLYHLPESLTSASQKQILYLSDDIYARHRADLDNAWINSIPYGILNVYDSDVAGRDYVKYLLNLAFDMTRNDFKAEADQAALDQALRQLWQLIYQMRPGAIRQEEFDRIDAIVPNDQVVYKGGKIVH